MNTPRIYVGTYAEYNNGSIRGAWLDLDDYADAAEFYDACRELHKRESDPEFMFQDWENIPDEFICESGIDSEFWDYLDAIEASHLDGDVFEAGMNCGIEWQNVEDQYYGEYSSDENFAMEYADQIGAINEQQQQWPYTCIDWEMAARDLMMDFCSDNDHYFLMS